MVHAKLALHRGMSASPSGPRTSTSRQKMLRPVLAVCPNMCPSHGTTAHYQLEQVPAAAIHIKQRVPHSETTSKDSAEDLHCLPSQSRARSMRQAALQVLLRSLRLVVTQYSDTIHISMVYCFGWNVSCGAEQRAQHSCAVIVMGCSNADGDGQGPMTARIYVDGTKSCSLELQVAAAVAQQSKPTIRRSSTGGEHFIEGDSRKNSNGHSNDSSRTVNATDASLNLSSVWELRALNPQDAKCLVDASLDLGDSLTPVPMPFSSLHSCSVLPMRTIMLGLGNATQGSATRHALFSSGVQPAALFLYPKLSDRALQQFIEDNRTTKVRTLNLTVCEIAPSAPHNAC